MQFSEYWPEFFTATILEWKHLLKPDKYKDIITQSLSYLVQENRVKIFGFVIMSNHLHCIWQAMAGHTPQEVQHSFLKFTAQTIIKDLRNHHPEVLERFYVGARDRKHQIWKRNALSIEIRNRVVFNQKLDYINYNPVKAGLCVLPEEYYYSSASFYLQNNTHWNWLTNWADWCGLVRCWWRTPTLAGKLSQLNSHQLSSQTMNSNFYFFHLCRPGFFQAGGIVLKLLLINTC